MFRERVLGRRSDLGFLEREGVRVEGGRSSWGGQRGPQATHLWNSVAMVRKLVFYYLHKRGFPGLYDCEVQGWACFRQVGSRHLVQILW